MNNEEDIKQCSICGDNNNKLYNTFGKLKCKSCIEKSSKNIIGNSGMIYNENIDYNSYYDIFYSELSLVSVKKSHPLYVKWYIEHYPKSKGIVGRQLNYLIYYDNLPIGIIGLSSPPLNYKIFRNYFQTDNEKLFLNNNVFRIVRKPNDSNIGTKILKILRTTSPRDYHERYGDNLLGIVTFVEKPRTGSIYKADNWDYLGETQGIEVKRRGDDWFQKQYSIGEKKLIFGIKLKHKLFT